MNLFALWIVVLSVQCALLISNYSFYSHQNEFYDFCLVTAEMQSHCGFKAVHCTGQLLQLYRLLLQKSYDFEPFTCVIRDQWELPR